jgi:hypothetical protein
MPVSVSRSATGSAAAGLLVAVGMILAALLLGRALVEFRAGDRYVTVRGLAERDVPADLAVWPIRYTVSGDDLPTVHRDVAQASRVLREYLAGHGFGDGDLESSPVAIVDLKARAGGGPVPAWRYEGQAVMTLRSDRVAAVQAAAAAAGGLLARGVALSPGYPPGPQYFFTGLATVKPEMIAEATRDARRAAARFAADSGSTVGGIRQARQGYFSIEDRDPFAPQHKRIRVVTTVEYFLAEGTPQAGPGHRETVASAPPPGPPGRIVWEAVDGVAVGLIMRAL